MTPALVMSAGSVAARALSTGCAAAVVLAAAASLSVLGDDPSPHAPSRAAQQAAVTGTTIRRMVGTMCTPPWVALSDSQTAKPSPTLEHVSTPTGSLSG